MQIEQYPMNNLIVKKTVKKDKGEEVVHFPKCHGCGAVLTNTDMCPKCLGEDVEPIHKLELGTGALKFYWQKTQLQKLCKNISKIIHKTL